MYSGDTIIWQYLAAMVGVGGRLVTLRRLPITDTTWTYVLRLYHPALQSRIDPSQIFSEIRSKLVKRSKGMQFFGNNK